MALRRQLAAAWDLAFNWVSGEPRQHHPAMPVSVLLALCSLALLWGWPLLTRPKNAHAKTAPNGHTAPAPVR